MAVSHPDQASASPLTGETIEQLFHALESPLLNYALRLTGALGAAEDVVQEAFMKLHVQYAEVREPRRWLYRTVHNSALNHRRDSAKLIPFDPPAAAGENPRAASATPADTADADLLPDEQIARWENIGLVRLSLKSLDDRSRELVHLKFHENLSYKQIAARTGLTVGHVGYLLHHALKSIAAELARNGVEP
jgi:RNA polymerase sigma-70 factor (ECF subfamily)